ncbi:uncharacterized protein J3R85_016674 [Psidium guajava]|nr:uncharacterized protein J3R85_016674 [Psidium guajava]
MMDECCACSSRLYHRSWKGIELFEVTLHGGGTCIYDWVGTCPRRKSPTLDLGSLLQYATVDERDDDDAVRFRNIAIHFNDLPQASSSRETVPSLDPRERSPPSAYRSLHSVPQSKRSLNWHLQLKTMPLPCNLGVCIGPVQLKNRTGRFYVALRST